MTHPHQKPLTWIGITAIVLGFAVTGQAAGAGTTATQAISPFGLVALNQKLSLSGALYLYEPANPKAPPLPGYRAYLYSSQSKRWIGPSITDNYGRYAFYDVTPGTYLLRIYPPGYRGKPNQSQSVQSVQPHVWQQEVRVPGKVKPIVLKRS